ncbi:hypothetical protein ILUMI_27443 [Ignelater luminosus]|uniref:Uncharacterized protein n=1 Tax=Ignelater luminosus TaxID=2038154 RepID=A0A8K0FWX2_IGNLU|nr:hypothetical protein ILUMI_27443 [Ignelater luminosus]
MKVVIAAIADSGADSAKTVVDKSANIEDASRVRNSESYVATPADEDASPHRFSSCVEVEIARSGREVSKDVDLKGVGRWPKNVSDDLRVVLVQQASAVLRNLDSKFSEMSRSGVSAICQAETRRPSRTGRSSKEENHSNGDRSIVFKSTPDVSRMDQNSQVLRYVKIEVFQVAVVESFVNFIETKGVGLNLLSVSQMTAKGLNIVFTSEKDDIYQDEKSNITGQVKAHGDCSDGLYRLEANGSKYLANACLHGQGRTLA